MKLYKKTSRLLALVLAAALVFAGCGEQGGESLSSAGGEASSLSSDAPLSSLSSQGESPASSQSQAEPTPSPDPTPSPTPAPVLATVEGEITAASKSVVSLLLEDGSLVDVLLTDETQHTGGEYLNGNTASVTYDENAREGEAVTALSIDVAVPEKHSAAEDLLASMTLEEKVGQLFFVRVPDMDAAQVVSQYHLGGYILFGRDFSGLSKEQVQQNIQSYQDSASIPLLIGVDEEGGTVVRASSNPAICDEPYWSPRALYNAGGLSLLTSVEQDKIATLEGLGINVNFAPVCDITLDSSAFMYDRSLGLAPEEASQAISAVVSLYGEEGMGCVLKHFPGYGNNVDTHTGIAVDGRSYETFQQEDFLPFEAGISAGAGCVLVSHNVVTCKDGEYPASLSPEWHRILREELGFTGCIITDDLVMDAIQDYCDASSAAVQAVLAGNDLLCCSDYQTQYLAVLAAVEDGTISEERIDESVLRVLRWKAQLGLL